MTAFLPSQGWLQRLSIAGAVLAAVVVVLGAYVRLTESGLACPDWPGCYGRPYAPLTADAVYTADGMTGAVDPGKAWIEMIHRYAAGTLLLLILTVFLLSRGQKRGAARRLASALLGVVALQALLGMWTVTERLHPLVVTAHLLGGLATLALLSLLALRYRRAAFAPLPRGSRRLARVAGIVLLAQLALGGWTSSHNAALVCGGFPSCRGQWWPAMDFAAGFDPLAHYAALPATGDLGLAALTAIHWSHRLGAALLTALVVALYWSVRRHPDRKLPAALLGLTLAQLSLGAVNVMLARPLATAVLHSAVAALLLVCLLALNVQASARPAAV